MTKRSNSRAINIITGSKETGAGAQQRDRRRDSEPDLVLNFLDRAFEADLVLFESEFGEVVIDEEREAEAEQEDQIRQENAIAARSLD